MKESNKIQFQTPSDPDKNSLELFMGNVRQALKNRLLIMLISGMSIITAGSVKDAMAQNQSKKSVTETPNISKTLKYILHSDRNPAWVDSLLNTRFNLSKPKPGEAINFLRQRGLELNIGDIKENFAVLDSLLSQTRIIDIVTEFFQKYNISPDTLLSIEKRIKDYRVIPVADMPSRTGVVIDDYKLVFFNITWSIEPSNDGPGDVIVKYINPKTGDIAKLSSVGILKISEAVTSLDVLSFDVQVIIATRVREYLVKNQVAQ